MSSHLFIFFCCLFFLLELNTHSGTVLDLPYRFSADDTKMRLDRAFNMKSLMGKLAQPEALAFCACLMFMLLSGND
jgi:hypothetical protein